MTTTTTTPRTRRPPAGVPSIERADLQGNWQVDHPILCVASRSPLDQAACAMLAQLLDKHGLPARVQSFTDVASARSFKIDAADAPLSVCHTSGAPAIPRTCAISSNACDA